MRITLRLYNKGKIKKYFGTSVRRMLYWINHSTFEKAYVKVHYGRGLAVNGEMTEFKNDGYYDDKKELLEVLKVFWYES
jgi:hypothetical protein